MKTAPSSLNGLALALVLLLACVLAACSQRPESKEQARGKKDPNRCASCHVDDYRSARDHAGKKPLTCFICHGETSFHPPIKKHPWPLLGAHDKASCFACHKGASPTFNGTPKACLGCHAAEYDRGPSHVIENYPTKCEQCHDTVDWHHQLKSAPKR